ncbi:EamA/RhaT family transporter [Roseobacter denitrificans]|uniref:Integral membrane protein, putative n=1 Tax=Roseobacter denitrificans (strain ATCC 33942 / OCh 114) TaxID=375451 RepID=Q160Q7_ROSDO|nr:DMT family transporter [Roseobacter denitrificans]ABG33536.1 integral membrane protein, putative [Roseobacter denitrificans OCh 114]AVL52849.1 EamA/RhaT family transporter [Roseobacter denitrificans]SFG04626.1 S-adenosylmethionine uptake transporter [Roseobacter denitrificans OCh 114]
MTTSAENKSGLAILFILFGVLAISVNDMLIKQLSGDYPLHELVFLRSALGLAFSMFLVQMEGGWRILKTRQPVLHAIRGLLIVAANMSYFAALAALPLADATALFFAAPLLITLLSIPILGEKVGILRMTAVLVGFCGVILMQRPWAGAETLEVSRLVLLLPVFAALMYALNQLMTRKLGVSSKASALSVYIHMSFIVVSLGFYLVAGDGRFAAGTENPSLQFLLRAWIWPSGADWWFILGMGANAAIIGYCLSQAYRIADAATVAPFEYVGLPLAVFWGWLIFAQLPVWEVWAGIALILGSGLFVFLREQQKARVVARGPIKRQ